MGAHAGLDRVGRVKLGIWMTITTMTITTMAMTMTMTMTMIMTAILIIAIAAMISCARQIISGDYIRRVEIEIELKLKLKLLLLILLLLLDDHEARSEKLGFAERQRGGGGSED